MADEPAHVAYNDNLAHLRDIDRSLATEKGYRFADVHGAMVDAMTKDQLAAGVNLAAEFPHTPFDEPFAHFQAAVAEKQNFETFMIKQIVTDFRLIPDFDTDAQARAAAKVLSGKLMKRWEALDQAARERFVPVTVTLRIEPTAG